MGGTFGMFSDLYRAGIDADVLNKINAELAPGKSAVVASVDEVWTTPLEVKMKEVGGTVYRKARIDIVDEQIDRDIAALDAELRELQQELNVAGEEATAWGQAKIDSSKASIRELNQKTMDRLVELDNEFHARQAALDAQISKAVEGAKAKLEKRKAELTADYKMRKEKLQHAAKLAGEALT